MQPGRPIALFRNRKRWALALVLVLAALFAGAVVAPRQWRHRSGQDTRRLGLLKTAWDEFAGKRYDRATEILDRRALEVAPTSLDWMLRARIAESQGRPAQALDYLKRIPDADSNSAAAWLKAGQIELARGHALAAESAYRHAVTLNPDQIQSYRELAYLSALQRRRAECDAQFRTLNRLMPLDYTMAFAWCQNYCWLWDVDGARKVLLQFVAADPTDRWSRLALATSYELTGDLELAESTLAPIPNSDADARSLRVQTAFDRGEIDVAEMLARDGPDDHAGLNIFRGRAALRKSDGRMAAAHFRAALRQEPDNRDASHGLGVALQSLGDPESKEHLQFAFRYDQLKRLIKESVTTIQTDRKIFYKLGAICESLNLCEQARVWYQLAIGRDPLDAEAHQGLRRLGETTEPASERDKRPEYN
jgi:tetratricopeptide (TPR) repeat protein